MKIINQTADELVLKDGNISGIIIGVVLFLVGVGIFYEGLSSGSTAMWIGIAVLIVGLLFIFISSSINVDMNKTSGQILYQKKHLVGGKSTSYDILNPLFNEKIYNWIPNW